MLNLVFKDFRRLFGGEGKLGRRALKFLTRFLFIGLFIAIESYIYYQVVTKIASFEGAVISFSTLFMFILSLVMIVFDLFQAEKLFFDESDAIFLSKLPIGKGKVIASKLFLLFMTHYIASLMLVYPIIVSYGISKTAIPFYYIMGLLFPFITFFFEGGIAMILVYPFHLIKKNLKHYPLAMFLVSVAIMTVFTIFYGRILDVFISLVGNEGINSFLTAENMGALGQAKNALFISNFLVDAFFLSARRSLIMSIVVALSVFLIGLMLVLRFYGRRTNLTARKSKVKPLTHTEVKPIRALIRKEATILFRDSDGLFGYTGLLIVQPFLCYSVCFALNTLFTTGALAYYLAMFPGFATIVLVFTFLFFVAISSSGANDYITREGNGIRVCKTIPVPPSTQVLAKILVPFAFSASSMIVTSIVLMSTFLLPVTIGFLALACGILLLAFLVLAQFVEELKRKTGAVTSRFFSTFLSYFYPLALLGLGLGLGYLRVNVEITILIVLGAIFVGLLPYGLRFVLRINRFWTAMEVSS